MAENDLSEPKDDCSKKNEKPLLRLFVSRDKANSIEAEKNFLQLFESHLKTNYCYEVIDILQNPIAALENNVPIVPMLIRVQPGHNVTIIGTFRDTEKILTVLQLME